MNSNIKRPLHSKLEIRFFWESAPATIKQNASHYGDDSIIGVIDFSFMSIVKGEKGDKGEKGETGDTGPRGLTGKTGPKGDKGEKGDEGIFNFEVRDGNLILKYSNLKPQADFHINEQGQLIATIN